MGDGQSSRVGMGVGKFRASNHRLCVGNVGDVCHRAVGAEGKNLIAKLLENNLA